MFIVVVVVSHKFEVSEIIYSHYAVRNFATTRRLQWQLYCITEQLITLSTLTMKTCSSGGGSKENKVYDVHVFSDYC